MRKLEGDGQLLRIFIGESDRWNGRPLYQELVAAARKHRMAGATVIRGRLGFGPNSRIRTDKILRLSEDMSMVVEIVDTAERIDGFLPVVDEMVCEGMVTVEKAHIIFYGTQAETQGE